MIRSFADRQAEALFHGRYARRLPANIQRVAQRKLRQLHSAEDLRDLAAPPENRLEALRGSRPGQTQRTHRSRRRPGPVATLLRLDGGERRAGRDRRPSPRMTDMRDLPPIHPGEQLREEFMRPLGLTAYRL